MKLLLIVLLLAVLTSGARLYRPSHPRALAHPVALVPPSLLWGHGFAESSLRADPPHPDPLDVGMFGLRETAEIHAERAAKWGEYDARNPVQAWHIAAHVIADNLAAFDSLDMATTAYKWGPTGARSRGVDREYVERVRGTR
jgi:hypothetical protein